MHSQKQVNCLERYYTAVSQKGYPASSIVTSRRTIIF